MAKVALRVFSISLALSGFAVACSGGANGPSAIPSNPMMAQGNGIPSTALERPSESKRQRQQIALDSSGKAVTLPSTAGITERITLPSNDAPPGAKLEVTVSSALPRIVSGMPVQGSLAFLSFTIRASSDVRLYGVPRFSVRLPSRPANHGAYYAWAFNPQRGWLDFGPVSVAGNVLRFGGSSKNVTLQSGITYAVIPFTAAPNANPRSYSPPSYTMSALPLDVARAINNHGVVAGAVAGAAATFDHGTLTIFPKHANSQGAEALDINDDGIAVGYDTSGKQVGGICAISAFLAVFHPDKTVSYVGPQPYPQAQLDGINNNGISTGVFGVNAVSYPPLQTVFSPVSAGSIAIGHAINETGVIVGEYGGFPTGNRSPFAVPVQPGCCGTGPFGTATDINSSGHIVGDSYVSDPNATKAWFYAGGVTQTLPLVPGAGSSSPKALNDTDTIVGEQFIGSGIGSTELGVLWQNGQVYDLNSLVTNKPAGVNIEIAIDINNGGQIVTFVCCGAPSQYYLLTPH